MKNISISSEQIQEIVIDNLPKIITDAFDGYNSPIKKAVETAISEKEGEIKKLVDRTLKDILTNEEFRTTLGEKILESVLANGLKR